MSHMTVGVIGIVIMLALMSLGIPIGYVMGLVGFAGVWYFTSTSAVVVLNGTIPYNLISNYNYCVLPLFFLMANICMYTGLGRDLFGMMYKWMGRMPGGLAVATVAVGGIFGSIASSAVATCLTVGVVSLPEMKRYGYDDALATGCVACGGILGILIPPSGILIIYGIMTEQSIGALFIAGLIPGAILTLMFMLYVILACMVNPKLGSPGPRFSFKEKILSIGPSAEMILLIILILAGLIVGWFTPTESAAIGATGAIVFSLFRKRLKMQDLKTSLWDTASGSGMIYVMIMGALIFNGFVALSQIPMDIADVVAGLGLHRLAIIVIIIVIYLIMGTFMDELAMVLLTLPIFFPIANAVGVDPIWFGILVTWAIGIGGITPPVGMAIYVTAGIAKDVPLSTVIRGCVPFVVVELIFVVFLIAFPQMATWLPGLMN